MTRTELEERLQEFGDDAPEVEFGTIVGFRGSWGSGIGFLLLEDEEGNPVSVPCENAATVRCLEAAYGDIITEGHSVDNEALAAGRHLIAYSTDFAGVLDGFTPIEEEED